MPHGSVPQVHALFKAPVSFEQKKTALVYVNSNCGAKSGRSDIMRRVGGVGAGALARAGEQRGTAAQGTSRGRRSSGYGLWPVASNRCCVAPLNKAGPDRCWCWLWCWWCHGRR